MWAMGARGGVCLLLGFGAVIAGNKSRYGKVNREAQGQSERARARHRFQLQ